MPQLRPDTEKKKKEKKIPKNKNKKISTRLEAI